MQDRIKALYKTPFWVDKYNCYIWDADHNMVADFNGGPDEDQLRPRGWGRISTSGISDPEALHDACEAYLLSLVPEASRSDPETCVSLLNKAWASDDG